MMIRIMVMMTVHNKKKNCIYIYTNCYCFSRIHDNIADTYLSHVLRLSPYVHTLCIHTQYVHTLYVHTLYVHTLHVLKRKLIAVFTFLYVPYFIRLFGSE